jgi:hypothetical protein
MHKKVSTKKEKKKEKEKSCIIFMEFGNLNQ